MRVPVTELFRFTAEVLERIGMSRQNADVVADVLSSADRLGVGSHGVGKLPAYLARVDAGVMSVDPPMLVAGETMSAATLDAANGFGQVAASRAMTLAADKAAATGVAAVSVRNSNHFGMAGHYAHAATDRGMISLVMTNASPAMPPFNGKDKLLGTNPLAIGVPGGTMPPAVLDMSSSVVARGKIRRAAETGATALPPGWANDADGRPTTDPEKALTGSLAPIGGAKGAGLSLMIDLLTGVLSGTTLTGEVGNLLDPGREARTSHLMIALDPAKFVGADDFTGMVDAVLERISTMELAEGDRVYYPGLIETERARENETAGALLTADALTKLNDVAQKYGVGPLHST